MYSILTPTFDSFGLDISDYSLKLAKVRRKGSELFLQAFAHVDLPPGVISQGRILNLNAFEAKIQELRQSSKAAKLAPYVVTSLPEPTTFIKLFFLPRVKDEELNELLEKEAVKHFPYSLDEIEIDYQIVEDFSGHNSDQITVLVGVAPKDIVNQYMSALMNCELVPVAFEIEAQAISRSIIPINFEIKEALGIMDIGASRSSFIIFDHGVLQMSVSIPISGMEITKELANRLKVTDAAAEDVKIKCGLDDTKCRGEIRDVLLGSMEDLVNKIKIAVDSYYEHSPIATPMKRIFLCGGGGNTINIDKVLSDKLNMKVQRSDVLININGKSALNFITEYNAMGSATVLGLALRPHFTQLFI